MIQPNQTNTQKEEKSQMENQETKEETNVSASPLQATLPPAGALTVDPVSNTLVDSR